MVDLMRDRGITDARVLAAMNVVPRHLFLDSSFMEHAYQNKAFPIGADQTISHPYTVAFQSELLDFKPGDRILEIGTGSGYQCAVLLEMKAQVYTDRATQQAFLKKLQNSSGNLIIGPRNSTLAMDTKECQPGALRQYYRNLWGAGNSQCTARAAQNRR